MGSYFKLWRRKVGVVTLLIACVFMAAWARNTTISDILEVPFGTRAIGRISSAAQHLIVTCEYDEPNSRAGINTLIRYRSEAPTDALPLESNSMYWRWSFCGIRYGKHRYFSHDASNLHVERHLAIPYLSILIPLTLLSAWLLLSKPKTKRTRAVSAENF